MQDQMIHIFECLEGIGCNVKYLEDGLFYSSYLIIIGYHICCGSKHLLSNCVKARILFLLKIALLTKYHSRYVNRRLFRQVYIKIIYYSRNTFANLNNTMQTKKHWTKNSHSYLNTDKIN